METKNIEKGIEIVSKLLAGEEVHSRTLDNYRIILRETFY